MTLNWNRLQSRLHVIVIVFVIILAFVGQTQNLLIAQQGDLPPYHVVWSPDGTLIATGGVGYFRLWQSETQELAVEWSLEEGEYIQGLTWNPNSRQIATISTDQVLRVWDVILSESQVEISIVDIVSFAEVGRYFGPRDVDWSPNAQYIAVAGVTSSGYQSYVWDTSLRQLIDTNRYGEEDILWTSDSLQFVYVPHDYSGYIGPVFTPFITDSNYVDPFRESIVSTALARSPDGQELAIGYVDGVVEIRDIVNGIQELSLDTGNETQNNGYVIQLVWTLDNRVLAIVVAPGGLQLWDILSAELIRFIPLDSQVQVAISPDGQNLFLAWSSTQIHIEPFDLSLPTLTPTLLLPTVTETDAPSLTPSSTSTLTNTATFTSTFTPTPTSTPTPTFTATFTPTPSVTCTATAANSPALVNAITAANANGSSLDTICLTTSTYTFTTASDSIALPSITTPITIVGNGAILERGNGAPQFRLFNVTASGSLTLQNLTVRNFHAGGGNGGAILSTGTVTLDGVTLMSNSARFAGGIHSSGTLTITNSTLSSNTSQEDAGAIYLNSGTLTISDTIFQSNSARYGSGIYANDGTVSLTNVIFRTNTANEQGAALFQRRGVVTISGGTFDANTARFGSAIYVRGALGVTGTTFTNNVAVEEGAAIYNENGNQSTVTVTTSTFTGNRARYGGAIYNRARLNVTSSTFTNNSATESGGAVYHQNGNAQNGIAQSCFSGNTARFGGAIFSQTGNFNAQNNWWGLTTGPTTAMVNNQVQFTPFLTGSCPN